VPLSPGPSTPQRLPGPSAQSWAAGAGAHLGVPEHEAGAAAVVDAEQIQLLSQPPVVPAAAASRVTTSTSLALLRPATDHHPWHQTRLRRLPEAAAPPTPYMGLDAAPGQSSSLRANGHK